jgi:hypothetical protein
MTYLTKTFGKLSASHFLRCRSERLSLVDIEEGEGRPASPSFYGTGNDPVSQSQLLNVGWEVDTECAQHRPPWKRRRFCAGVDPGLGSDGVMGVRI